MYFAPVLFKELTWGLLDSGHLFYSLKSFRISSPAVKNTCFCSVSVMKSDTDTGSMQKGAMSATGRVGRKKNGTERGGTERRRRPDTSPPAGLPLVRHWASVGPGVLTRPRGRSEQCQQPISRSRVAC